MTMTICTECQGSISDKAATCPHCGAPVVALDQPVPTGTQAPTPNTATETAKRGAFRWWWIPLGLVGAFGVLVAQEATMTPEQKMERTYHERDLSAIRICRSAIEMAKLHGKIPGDCNTLVENYVRQYKKQP